MNIFKVSLIYCALVTAAYIWAFRHDTRKKKTRKKGDRFIYSVIVCGALGT